MNKFVYKRYKYPFQSIDEGVLSKILYNSIDAEFTAILIREMEPPTGKLFYFTT